jgi:hypothetical protein
MSAPTPLRRILLDANRAKGATMLATIFESLESRQMMSASSMTTELGLTGASEQPATVMSLSAGKTTTAKPVNLTKFKGFYREKTSSIIFVTTFQITKVNANGTVRGKLTIPWIVSNAEVRGKITSDRRFQLKFEENWGQATGTKGWYNGKVTSDFNKVVGTMKYGFGQQPATTAKGFAINFGRKA